MSENERKHSPPPRYDEAFKAGVVKMVTERHQPPVMGGRRGKIYYMTQADSKPPTFVFFVSDTERVRDSYIKYLENSLRKLFGIATAPVKVVCRASHKPKDER